MRQPATAGEVVEAVAGAATLELVGGGSGRGVGRPVIAETVLDLSRLAGVVDWQPEELVLTVRPGTPLVEIAALLATRRQQLGFEPPDLGPLLGAEAGRGTIGGVALAARSGPRRLTAGAARDHVLGFKAVNGLGEAFAGGGRVVKNVTGFDVTKLVVGSYGTLCAVTELTFKLLPAAEGEATVVLWGLDDAAAVAAMSRALGSHVGVAAAAHLPRDIAATSAARTLADGGTAATLLRLEGVTAAMAERTAHLLALFSGTETATLAGEASRAVWREVADVAAFAGGEQVVWRLSVAPKQAPALAAAIGGRRFFDWGGGLVWLALDPAPDAHAARVRGALAAAVGDDGHATLIRAPAAVRAAVSPFQPLSAAVAALTARVRAQFDPAGRFNPGRM